MTVGLVKATCCGSASVCTCMRQIITVQQNKLQSVLLFMASFARKTVNDKVSVPAPYKAYV